MWLIGTSHSWDIRNGELVSFAIVILAIQFYLRSLRQTNNSPASALNWDWLFPVLLLSSYAVFAGKNDGSNKLMKGLIAGILIGKAFGIWFLIKGNWHKLGFVSCATILAIIIPSLLTFRGSSGSNSKVFYYHSAERMAGAWSEPNTFGCLCGVGLVLAIAQYLSLFSQQCGPRERWFRYGIHLFFPPLIALTLIGLIGSYSRGAWVATVFALLFWWIRIRSPTRKRPNVPIVVINPVSLVSLCAIFIGMVVFACWQLRDSQVLPVRRAMSIFNRDDFSWQNRLSAWTGSLQIIVDNPFGNIRDDCEELYTAYYLPSDTVESSAIHSNSLLLAVANLGLVNTALLLVYVGTFFRPSDATNVDQARNQILKAGFSSAAVIVLISFWFHGGICELPKGALFWVLLEGGGGTGEQIQVLNAPSKT